MKGVNLIILLFIVVSCKENAPPAFETSVVLNSLVIRREIGDRNHPLSKLSFEDSLVKYELAISENFFGYGEDVINYTNTNFGTIGISILGKGEFHRDSVLRELRPYLSCYTKDCNYTAFEYSVLLNDTVFRIDRSSNKEGVDFCSALFSKFSRIEKSVEMRFENEYKIDSSFFLFDSSFDSISRTLELIDKKS
ncbi:hypothetical protein SAMN05216474_3083 [Lishizhenia tianjinensis]|uniref:Lipoprotein n=1 Tax=Lishizhenia tianjinensis TaxID=477690 RepID=A0A1I7BU96_9FLAO|nr:hypothetical protein [Lishizhenia tianjinensis]SFT90722.1 hypothetical protein SAMN05216474_3083 [Lishizhenia tianjinensis]